MTANIATEQVDDLCGYDSIIGISQNTINSQFCGLYKLQIIDNEIDEENDKGSVKAKFSAPTVTLQIKNSGRLQEVILNIGFRRGELKLKTKEGSETIPLENVLLGFKSLIEKNVVKKSDLLTSKNVTEGVKNTLRDLDDRFDIEYLYISFKKSVTPGNLVRMEGIANLDALKVLIDLLAQHHSEAEGELSPFGIGFQPKHRAGLALEDANAAPTIPSLVPTSVDYSLTLNTKQPELSTFNFLMMTSNRPAPTPKPYIGLQMIDSSNLQGRYMAAERLVLQDGLLKYIRDKCETTAPFTWNEELKRWQVKSEILVKREEHVIQDSKVVITLKAYPECRVNIPRRQQPMRFDLDLKVKMEATFTVNGNPGDLSPLHVFCEFSGKWDIRLKNDDQLYLKGDIVQAPDYETNNNWYVIYQPEWSRLPPIWHAVRTALGAFGGGSWAVIRFYDLAGMEGPLNMGRAVLPLGNNFFFKNVMIDGVKNSNLQVDLTYKN